MLIKDHASHGTVSPHSPLEYRLFRERFNHSSEKASRQFSDTFPNH